MRLLHIYTLVGCLLVSAFAKAQDTLSYETFKKNNKERVGLERDTITIIDSITTTSFVNEIDKVELKTLSRDSVVFKLEDEPLAARLDSLWRHELARMDLYDSITNMVQGLEYKEEVYLDLPTDTLKKRLALINERTPFNVGYTASLESVIKGYLKRHKPSMERLMEISQFYFPMFEETLDKYDIPLEMKYLAIVESALRPRAKSRVGATGLWQFMFSTGKIYGLDVNSYVDERMDPIMATEAACQYLSKLYELFGDWDLALASYNSGPGNVSKAIRRSGGYQNYWNIRNNLPRETAGYVPAFLATMYLFEYADEHGYQPKKAPVNYFETDTVHVKQLITLEQVAKITGEPLEVIQFLNPSYKLDIIPVVKDEKYYLRLPVEKIGPFVQNEEEIYAFAKAEIDKREKPLPKFTTSSSQVRYRVRSGDYLGKIANRYGVRVSQIKKWNNLKSNNLRVGQRLTIYPRKPVTSSSSSSSAKTVVNNGKKVYTVKQGDSLWKIANKFPGVSVSNIKVWNDISGTNLKPGMKLIVSK
ncbi:lytic transglycosylase [Dokdonia pacifica]|uniref:Membrane-bound lytic murein transglycosylase D n=1 Tax=Dokdonia pacifica TaxID=1627892 RepID=A0A238WGM8_9FLAO|nr:LysM peptidoglycan-binding domain-containing protein [Dokdonia pacifica]GGG20858.1 lytic transglycosylase [Dokdonia pacifica]SNR45374.1 membrane-bound lytic murein transglycosylase D [Dokdonia pacifica]